MQHRTHISTHDTPWDKRLSLVQDAAFNLFNLEVNVGRVEPRSVTADIHVVRSAQANVVNVITSASTVRRTRRRSQMAASDHLMVYLIKRGGSWFRNARGHEFQTAAGSVVVGSQDAAYQAGTAPGQDWNFHALSLPEHMLSHSALGIRQGGFQLAPAHAPLHGLLSSYLGHFCQELLGLNGTARAASLAALDHLLAATLNVPGAADEAGLAPTVANERHRRALRYIEAQLESPALSPATIASHLCISPRQLHRAFEATGRSVAAEIRRLRLAHARHLVCSYRQMPVTSIALSCGFESLATFYRTFKAEFGGTASDLRDAEAHMPAP